MKTQESGMPSEETWQGFFDPKRMLEKMGLTAQCQSVVDFGCGYGTFTIPAARMIEGNVYALDIEPEMLAATSAKVVSAGLQNIETIERDFAAEGSGFPDGSIEYVMLFNILHAEERMTLLKEAWRLLAGGGRLAVVNWNHDANTPRGPSMNIRPRPDECRKWGESVGFVLLPPDLIDLPPYHYGFVFERPNGRRKNDV